MSATETGRNYAQFLFRLGEEGLRPALSYLLSLTDYRFIAIFRFQAGKANAAVYYDREAPEQLTAEEVPDTATYCGFVRDAQGVFSTADARADSRLEGHPAREVVLAYCGVPLLDPEGVLLGTLCHYDLQPRDPEQIDLELMLGVAGSIVSGNHVPPYPEPAPLRGRP